MEPVIKEIEAKRLFGKMTTVSLTDHHVTELWKSLMTGIRELGYGQPKELFSISVYPPGYFSNFDPGTAFEKWAAIEMDDTMPVPEGLELFQLPAGQYAVFLHLGDASDFYRTYQYIFGVWLPASGYVLDERPHFELLGEKYRNNDPSSEEEVWIPVKLAP